MTAATQDIRDLDIRSHLHPFTNAAQHAEHGPLVVVRGEGIRVQDDRGNWYIEGMSGLWCASLGFSHSKLIEAGCAALRTLPYYHTFNHRTSPAVAQLADRLRDKAPAPMARTFFASSGSEANDTAVKLVWYFHNVVGKPLKKKIISRQRGYHGVTVAAASMTGLPASHGDFDLPLSRMLHVGCPHHYRAALPNESPEAFATRLANELEARILEEGPETVAAFIAEPVQGAGGVVVPPPTYFEKVQAVLRKHDVLFIADEVICGFGRTGHFWGSQTFGLQPDILTCAKAMSSGYAPISAVMINDRVYQAVTAGSARNGVFGHGYTYSGHPVSAAIALAALDAYESEDIMSRVGRIAPRFQSHLKTLDKFAFVGEVRGIGLIAGIELVADRAGKTAFPATERAGSRLAQIALEEGLIVRAMGDTIALCPPLICTDAEIDELCARLHKSFDRFALTV